MTAYPTDEQHQDQSDLEQPDAIDPELANFRYDSSDSNQRAVERQKRKDQQQAQQSEQTAQGKKRKKRKRQESKAGRFARNLLEEAAINLELTPKNIAIGILILLSIVLYIYIGYSVQGQQVRINRLHDSLERCKFDALNTSSELMHRTRKSEIHKILNAHSDSLFESSPTPPYVIE